jgi:hypothetical protein
MQDMSACIRGQDGQAIVGHDGEEVCTAVIEAMIIGHRRIILRDVRGGGFKLV